MSVLLLILLGVTISVGAVESATDAIVRDYLTYQRILDALLRHIQLVVAGTALAVGVGVGVGMLLSRPALRRWAGPVVAVANVGQSVPSLAVLALFMGLLGLGWKTAIFALWVYSLLPVLHNTYTGLTGVDSRVLDAARGMGMRPVRILQRVELPLAAPVIMAGVRTAVVVNVGTAPLATFVAAGGLGDLIVTGISLNRMSVLMVGATLTAILALVLDRAAGWVEQRLTPWRKPVVST